MSINIVSNDDYGNHLDWIKKFASQADTLILASPFLSQNIGGLLEQLPSIKKIILYTNLDGFNMAGATIQAVYSLYRYCENKIALRVYCNDNLHGKVYLLYRNNEPKGFFVSSGNFTDKGLKVNQEYGVFIDNDRLQADMLDRLQNNKYDEILFSDAITIMNKAKEFEEKNPANKVPTFKANQYIKRNDKATGVRYFLKLLGSTDKPYIINRSLKTDNPIGISESSYNEFIYNLPQKGDIFICHAVGKDRACIVGYCKILNDVPNKENRYEGDKWNFKYYIEDLNEDFSSNWYSYRKEMKTNLLRDEFLNKRLPNQKVTLVGDSLGAINYGKGLIEISEAFAQFIIDKVNNMVNKNA